MTSLKTEKESGRIRDGGLKIWETRVGSERDEREKKTMAGVGEGRDGESGKKELGGRGD